MLSSLGLDWKTIKQVLVVALWIAAGLAATLGILLIPRLLGFVGPGWNGVIESAPPLAALIFTVAGVLFVGGRRRTAFAVAGITLSLFIALDAAVVCSFVHYR